MNGDSRSALWKALNAIPASLTAQEVFDLAKATIASYEEAVAEGRRASTQDQTRRETAS